MKPTENKSSSWPRPSDHTHLISTQQLLSSEINVWCRVLVQTTETQHLYNTSLHRIKDLCALSLNWAYMYLNTSSLCIRTTGIYYISGEYIYVPYLLYVKIRPCLDYISLFKQCKECSRYHHGIQLQDLNTLVCWCFCIFIVIHASLTTLLITMQFNHSDVFIC